MSPPELSTAAQPQRLSDLPVAAQYAISAALGKDLADYRAVADSTGWTLANPANDFRAQWQSDVLHVFVGADTWDISLRQVGRGAALQPVAMAQVTATDNRVDCNYGSIDEWYINGPGGLQQGFTVAAQPAPDAADGSAPLTVILDLGGDLSATVNAAGDGLTLSRPDGTAALTYGGLVAYDATGKPLPATLEIRPDAGHQDLLISVSDAGAQGPITIDPFVQQAKLAALDGQADDQFGWSVAIGGDTVVVGGPGVNSRQGAAYVFTKPSSTWQSMTETAKLTASGGQAEAQFGFSVAISGDTVVVGAEGVNGFQGAAYVFTKPGLAWENMTETAKLTASDAQAGDYFGFSVAISGDTVVVGAEGVNGYQGAAYVFTKPSSAWENMTETAKLTASDAQAGDNFGSSAAISNETVVVGAPGVNTSQGAAYVFSEPGPGWTSITETAKLTASDGQENDYFGSAVATALGTVVVGAYGANTYHGTAYVFVEPGSGWEPMTETAKLTASGGQANDYFGSSVALGGDTVVVGAPGVNTARGAAYVFAKPGSGWANMTETAKLTASDGQANHYFGSWVALSGNAAVVGAYGANSAQGTAYVFGQISGPFLTVASSHSGPFRQGDNAGAGDIYSITVTNSGTSSSTDTATVSDTLPTGILLATAVPTTINGWSVTASGSTVTATRSDPLDPAASYPVLSLAVTVAANAAASVTNKVAVSSGSGTSGANDPTTIVQEPDLAITKSHSGIFRRGDIGDTYTITVSNVGFAPTTGTVTVTDILPTGLTPTAANNNGNLQGWSVSFNGQTVTATRSDVLAAAQSYAALTLTVNVAQNAPSSVTNTVTVFGGGQFNTANDAASDPTTIMPPPFAAAFLASDPLAPGKTVLYGYGTSGNDVIVVNPAAAAGDVSVMLNGKSLGTFHPTSRIVIHALAGNDYIGISDRITLPAWLYGDDGNDVVWGGRGPNVLLGGAGSDTLWGGRGRSLLIGGAGSDSLMSGLGDAILIGGTTNFDANEQALLAVLDEWNSAADYATRVSHYTGNKAGGLNGSYYLTAATVHDDGSQNRLVAGNAMDLFFQGIGDKIQGRRLNEIVISLSAANSKQAGK
jgi:uncharacterized repeat protein (TIGR01451 family)